MVIFHSYVSLPEGEAAQSTIGLDDKILKGDGHFCRFPAMKNSKHPEKSHQSGDVIPFDTDRSSPTALYEIYIYIYIYIYICI